MDDNDETRKIISQIEQHYPVSWQSSDNACLTTPTSSIFMVHAKGLEYEMIINEFHVSGCEYVWSKRIQNPYMFGRYLTQRKQLQTANQCRLHESYRFVCVDEGSVESVATHGIDYRRLRLQFQDLNLYASPDLAYQHNLFKNWVLIAARVTKEGYTTFFTSQVYPEYAVKFKV